MTEVLFATPGPLALLVIDITENSEGFEHAMTDGLVSALGKFGVPLCGGQAHKVTGVAGFSEVFEKATNWNALLLVAHGAPAASGNGAATIWFGEQEANWYWLGGVSMDLQDKTIFFAVCSGTNADSSYVFTEDHLALTVVGSTKMLSAREVLAFFPGFLADVAVAAKAANNIAPAAVRAACAKHGALANGKMVVKSAVG